MYCHIGCSTYSPQYIANWLLYDGSCYVDVMKLRTFSQARDYCKTVDGHLPAITDTDENDFVRTLYVLLL